MAGFTCTATLVDGSNKKSTFTANVEEVSDTAADTAFKNLLEALIPTYLGGRVTAVSITRAGTLPATNPSSPVATCDREHKAVFVWRTEGEHLTRMAFPTALDSAFVANTDVATVDFRTDVATIVNAGQFTDARGEVIEALVSATEAFAG